MPIWQEKPNSPACYGTNSTATVSPTGSRALLLKSGKPIISEHEAVSSRLA